MIKNATSLKTDLKLAKAILQAGEEHVKKPCFTTIAAAVSICEDDGFNTRCMFVNYTQPVAYTWPSNSSTQPIY